MTEKSAAELRDNVQAAVVQSDKADKTDAVCGIYYCDNAPNMNKLDLRSDGTAHFYYSNGMEIPSTRQTKQGWTLDGQKVTVGAKTFTIEQTDLIDNRGNRWLHIR